MSVVTESESNTTLVDAVSSWNLQSDELGIRAADTPIPTERISNDTLDILSAARDKLAYDTSIGPQKSKKRKTMDSTREGPSTSIDRNDYPIESKPIYLRLKANQRKKISTASLINKMHSELLKGIYPSCVQFKFNINSTRSEPIRKAWEKSIKECKERMTKALLDDLFVKYSTLKDAIGKDYDQLTRILTDTQVREIKDSLKKRDVGMAPMLELKTKRQFDPPKPLQKQQQRTVMVPKKRKAPQQKGRPQNQNQNKQLQGLVNQLKKMLN